VSFGQMTYLSEHFDGHRQRNLPPSPNSASGGL
jgi:hypothetical protein